MFKRILIAVDESEPAARAVEIGTGLSVALGADTALVHVIDPSLAYVPEGGGSPTALLTELRREGQRLLATASARAASTGLRPEVLVREGNPAEEILTAASEWGADLIAVGTHGRRGLERLLLGSTAEAMARQAPCPVLTVGAEAAAVST